MLQKVCGFFSKFNLDCCRKDVEIGELVTSKENDLDTTKFTSQDNSRLFSTVIEETEENIDKNTAESKSKRCDSIGTYNTNAELPNDKTAAKPNTPKFKEANAPQKSTENSKRIDEMKKKINQLDDKIEKAKELQNNKRGSIEYKQKSVKQLISELDKIFANQLAKRNENNAASPIEIERPFIPKRRPKTPENFEF
ncbi:unnamed protein product [Blepharisma stoltei]|uniref:Uncharacterized protein n=1 Tax=Blepharisma stoltei TaxID=1481888 RepID=A0AAU9JNN6_9CILI|nr:unnamed protein product [Blepharisma stoltei]